MKKTGYFVSLQDNLDANFESSVLAELNYYALITQNNDSPSIFQLVCGNYF